MQLAMSVGAARIKTLHEAALSALGPGDAESGDEDQGECST